MLHSVMNALFPVWPSADHVSDHAAPQVWGSAVSESRNGTYVACLDCGKEFAYDWKSMRIGDQMAERPAPQEAEAGVR